MKVSTSVMTGTALIGAVALGLALHGLAPSPAKAEPLIADLSELAEMAAKDPTAATNPVPAGPREMLSIYRAAFAGRLE